MWNTPALSAVYSVFCPLHLLLMTLCVHGCHSSYLFLSTAYVPEGYLGYILISTHGICIRLLILFYDAYKQWCVCYKHLLTLQVSTMYDFMQFQIINIKRNGFPMKKKVLIISSHYYIFCRVLFSLQCFYFNNNYYT